MGQDQGWRPAAQPGLPHHDLERGADLGGRQRHRRRHRPAGDGTGRGRRLGEVDGAPPARAGRGRRLSALSDDDLAFAGVARTAELLAAGEVTSARLVELFLGRIARLDPDINAFRVVRDDAARAEAAAADAARAAGDDRPLLGVPIAVKDTLDVVGETTLQGTSTTSPPALRDAELVRRLRAAGLVVIGKTTLPELALWPFTESPMTGTTRNPWNPGRITGGSSGGSAAAVAAGLVPAATGSDGGGSIRIPAACCGLVGLKAQRDRVPMAPDSGHWEGLSHAGFLTRSVRDTALLLDAVTDTGGSVAALDASRPLRVIWSTAAPTPIRLDAEVREAIADTVTLLRSLGHEVSDRPTRPPYGAITAAFFPRYLAGVRADLRRLPDPQRTEARTRRVAALGAALPRRAVALAHRLSDEATRRMDAMLDTADVLVLPVLSRPPLPHSAFRGRGAAATIRRAADFVPFTPPWNVTGQPAMSVPAGFTADGLPLAVQLVARSGDEATLLALATQLEQARDWTAVRPPIS